MAHKTVFTLKNDVKENTLKRFDNKTENGRRKICTKIFSSDTMIFI
jgi:hypothetical protein